MEEAVVGMFAIFTIFVVLPGMVMYFLSRRRETQGAASGNAPVSADLEKIAEKLERRVQSLETILDAEVPGWRKNHERRER